MRGLALAVAALLLAAAGPAPARERVASIPPGPDTGLAQAGERVVWTEGSWGGQRSIAPARTVRAAAPGEPPRTLASFPSVPTGHPYAYQVLDVEASATHVAVVRTVLAARPISRDSVETAVLADELWAGPVDGTLARVADCTDEGGDTGVLSYDFAVDGARVVRQACDRGRGIVVHDLAGGGAREIARGGAGGRHLDLAGRFVAWEEQPGSDNSVGPRTIVVHDLDSATDAYRVDQPPQVSPSHLDFHVQADGKLLDPQFAADYGLFRPAWYAPSDPSPHELPAMNARVLSNDRTLEVHRFGELADLTVHGLDGGRLPVARMNEPTLGGADFDGERTAWSETRCGVTTIYTQRAGEPLSLSRSALEGRCARVSVPATATVSKRGAIGLQLRCRDMRTCVGTARLLDAGGATVAKRRFDFGRRGRGVASLRPPAGAMRVRVLVTDRNGLVLADRSLGLSR
ncbi:MAG TPA: hypothetical protein VF715_12035 [Thermoleophilaceae bacterium]